MQVIKPFVTPQLPCVEVATGPDARLAVIWLHGLGADGHDFEPIVPELGLGFAARFVFPHAPVRPVTINAGLPMRAWYDIVSIDRAAPEDEAGIRASAAAVSRLIDAEAERGTAPGRIVLAGFSQGGAIALHAGLRERRRLAGLLALSTYLPLAGTLEAERSPESLELPIFVAHGTEDPVVPFAFGEASRERLSAAGHAVEWHAYGIGHGVAADEIRAIGAWLTSLAARA